MKLLDHFLADNGIFSTVSHPKFASAPLFPNDPLDGRRYVASVAYRANYLMLAILAFSAHQLFVQRPCSMAVEEAQSLEDESSRLENLALADFNAQPLKPGSDNTEAIFLFSSFTGTKLPTFHKASHLGAQSFPPCSSQTFPLFPVIHHKGSHFWPISAQRFPLLVS